MESINPATENVIRRYENHDASRTRNALDQSIRAFDAWRQTSFDHRADLMRKVAIVLRQRSAEFSSLMTSEMGKPIVAAEGEIEKCAVACDYYAEHAVSMLTVRAMPSDATRSFVRFDPLGPILAIMPWNFPFWQFFRFAAPSLMAGNVAVLKHAANVPGCALAIEGVFHQAGFPAGIATALLIDNPTTEALIEDPAIAAVTLTGSTRAGRAVAGAAAKVLKKCVLELGGSDPFIVLRDVDVRKVAQAAAEARCVNAGQSCIAAKRFIVEEAVAGEFEAGFVDAMRAIKVGDPMLRGTQVGPLARADLRDSLHDQVRRSVEAGARLVTGGKPLDRKGYFYPPTVLTDVRPGMAAFDEETFGPVAAIVRAQDAEEAIALSNRSDFGLGASIWTRDIVKAERMAAQIESGMVFINGAVKSDPRIPFGGVKQSGYGRELSEFGIHEFVNIKSVWIKSD